MALDLKANTAVDVLIGPFIDDTDGKTAETGLTIAQADVRLSKNGQNMAQKNDNTSCVHDELGYYNCELDATDTNTEGSLVLTVHESGALPVRHEFNIMAEAAWDSLYAAKDTGYMDVNVKAVSEDTTAADNLESACDNYSVTRGLAGTALPAAAADAAGGLPISDAGELDLDTLASNVSDILTDTEEIGAAGAGLTEAGGDGDHLTEAGGDGDHLTAINLPNQTMDITGDITGNLSGSVGSVSGNVGGNVVGTIGELAAQAKADVNAEVDTALNTAIPGSPTANSINQRVVAIDALTEAGGDGDLAAILLDTGTTIPSSLGDIETDTQDIQSRIPAALVSGRMSSDSVSISGSTTAADNLEASAIGIVTGAAEAGTLSTTQMTSDLTEATDDHYNGRIIIWTSGVLAGQATDITAYTGASGLLTFTAVTEAPSATDTFVIL